jgi:cysteine protease ATG4
MMLANAFLLHFLGAEWQSLLETPRVMDSSHKVLKWFADSPSAPYSIQAIALLGDREFQKPVGDWHGPNTVAHILARLTRRHQPAYNTIRIHVALDGVLAKNGVYASDSADDDAAPADAAAAAGDDDAYEPPMPADVAAIILIPLRLGVSVFNMVYAESLLSLYALPEFLGFIGGRPSASYYFVGCQVPTRPHHLPPSSSAEIAQGPTFPAHLLYLDPHTTQPFVDLLTPNAAAAIGQPSSPTGFDMATLSNTATFRFPTVYRMQLSQIDPSLTLGFYTRNRTEFNALCEKLHPIVSAEHPPFVITEDNLHTQSTLCNDASDANQEDLLNFELGDDFQMDDD